MSPMTTPQAPWTWRIPARFNIGAACADVDERPHLEHAAALIFESEEHGTQTCTYGELARQTDRFAALACLLGLPAGDRITLKLTNVPDFPIAFLGALKMGAIAVPVSAQCTAAELNYVLRDAAATALVCDAATWVSLSGSSLPLAPSLRYVLLTDANDDSTNDSAYPAVLNLRQALSNIDARAPLCDTRSDDPAYLIYTSGTTGLPKGVLHAHRSLIGRLPAARHWFDWSPAGDRVLHSGRFNWSYVLGTGLMDPLFQGKTTIIYEGPHLAQNWAALIAKHRATIFVGVPTLFRRILEDSTVQRRDIPSLRHCMSAGESLSPTVMAAWRDRFELEIHEALGMTEISYYVSNGGDTPVRAGSAGRPQPGHQIRLLNPQTLQPAGPREEGVIAIPATDPGLFLGYWNAAENPASAPASDWFLTGDWATVDTNGYLWLSGRRDDQINSFGHRVSPLEIERALKTHPDVADCACAAQEVEHGTLIVAYVVPNKTAADDASCAAHLLTFARTRLARYKAPRVIYLVEDLPKTRNGKVQRRLLVPSMAYRSSAQAQRER